MLLPCRTELIELNSTLAVYQNTFKRLLNRFFILGFSFRQQLFYSTELNSTIETKSCYCRAAVELQSNQLSQPVARRLKQALVLNLSLVPCFKHEESRLGTKKSWSGTLFPYSLPSWQGPTSHVSKGIKASRAQKSIIAITQRIEIEMSSYLKPLKLQ